MIPVSAGRGARVLVTAAVHGPSTGVPVEALLGAENRNPTSLAEAEMGDR